MLCSLCYLEDPSHSYFTPLFSLLISSFFYNIDMNGVNFTVNNFELNIVIIWTIQFNLSGRKEAGEVE